MVKTVLCVLDKAMTKIVILDADPFSQEVLRRLLARAGLSGVCAVCAAADEASKADIYLSVGEVNGAVDILENDRFERPLRAGILLERVQRHLANGDGQADIAIGPYRLDTVSSVLIEVKSGRSIRLTDKEKHILVFLAGQGGEVVERRALLDEVWGYASTVETHTLETHIYRLRQKIEADPSDPKILITEEAGYRLGV